MPAPEPRSTAFRNFVIKLAKPKPGITKMTLTIRAQTRAEAEGIALAEAHKINPAWALG